MTTALIDTATLLKTFLLADSTLATAVTNRIWAGKVPDSQFGSMPRAALLILPNTAMAEIGVPVYTERYDLYCYDDDLFNAWQNYRKLFNALHRVGLQVVDTNKRIMQSWLVAGPTALLEPDMNWPYIFSAFNVIWNESVIV
ncbi:hypothetical protein KKH23_04475 [Patescibacteria group bacterium]|nr:hypothetical protein [Patescibacteria group bacterium]